jgi:hypothetical protein
VLGAAGQRRCERGAVARVFEVEGDGAHTDAAGERVEVVSRLDHGLVATGHHRVQAQSVPGIQGVDRDVAALRDDSHGTGSGRQERVAP